MARDASKRRVVAAILATGTALVAAEPAWAQSTGAAGASQPTREQGPARDADANLAAPGSDIVVTARRRNEKLQDVPIAVTAISGAGLAQANINRVQDIQQKVPGLTIQPTASGPNTLAPAIRGQRQFDAYITKDPAVAVYFADVVQNRPQGLNSALFDLQSVQILKGPQGTLFGRNTTGGALILTPVAPGPDFGGYIQAAYGNLDERRIEGAINIPISEAIEIRAAGSLVRRDGYTHNYTTGQDLDDEHKDNWRFSIRLKPTDWLENRTVLSGFRANENGVGYKLSGIQLGTPGAALFPLPALLAQTNALPFHSAISNLVNVTDIKTFGVSNVTEISLGAATIKNIAGYRYVGSYVNFDYDGLPVEIFRSDEALRSRQYSDELQLLGNLFDNSLSYIVGGFFFREKGFNSQTSLSFGSPRISIGDPVLNTSYSFFGQATYKLPFLEGVSLTAGARQNYDDRAITTKSTTNGICRITNANGMPLNPCASDFAKTFHKLTYTLSADWRINRDILVYLAHRKGYRTGGFNFGGNNAVAFTPFRPEIVGDYELGAKTDFTIGGMRGRFNVAAYTQDYTDIQRSSGFYLGGQFFATIINAASARISGVETELTLNPTRFIEIGATFSNIDAKYKKFIDPATGIDISKSELAGTPEYTFGGNASWTIPLGEQRGSIVARADLYHQSHTSFSDANYQIALKALSPTSRMPGYTIVNGRIEWEEVLGTQLALAVYGRNLFNRNYLVGGVDLAPSVGASGAFTGAPRTYGVEASYRF